MAKNRISLIGVPVDVCPPQELESELLEILAKPGTKQIIFLSIWDLLKARHKGDFAECLKNADLIIPISKSILKGAKFLKLPVPVRYNPFEAVIHGPVGKAVSDFVGEDQMAVHPARAYK